MRKSYVFSYILPALLALIISASPTICAQDTVIVNYQGLLTDRDTSEPLTGEVRITFTFEYPGGIVGWESVWESVWVEDGLFEVKLGTLTPLPVTVFDADELYLGIRVGDDPQLTPKTLITTVPYAAYAHNLTGGLELNDGVMVLSGPTADSGIIMTAGDALSIEMGQPPPDDNHPAMELVVDPLAGAGINIWDEIGKVMGFEPSPFNQGYSFNLFDPTWEPSSPLLTLKTEYDEAGVESSVDMLMFNPQPEPPGLELLKLGVASGGVASLRLGKPPPDDSYPSIEFTADPEVGASFLISNPGSEVMGVEPSPFGPGVDCRFYDPAPGTTNDLIKLSTRSDPASGESSSAITLFQPLPDMPGQEAISMSAMPGLGGSIKMFQPQPEPPGREILSIAATQTGVASVKLGEASGILMTSDATVSMIGIGTVAPSEALYVVGNIYATGSISEYSDASAKTNVRPLDGALAMVDDLQGVRYDWADEKARAVNGGDKEQIGFIAQDVEAVLPEVVLTVDDDKKAINYSRLTAVLVEAIKELKAENEELKSRIEALESK